MASGGAMVPLAAFAHWEPTNTSLSVNHQGQFVATTVSFNLPPGCFAFRRHPRRRDRAAAYRRA